MAGALKTIVFDDRQEDIPSCGIVNLKFTEGDVRAEYISGSEEEVGGDWEYTFLVQEEDLPGGLALDDVGTAGIIDPLWSCLADDEAVEVDETCKARHVSCFTGLPVIETLEEGDWVVIFRYDAECDTYCLAVMEPGNFKTELDALP